jgi:lysozyme family protein
MPVHRTRAGARFVAIAAIAAVAFGWVAVTGHAARGSAPPSVHRGNGLRAHPSVRVRAAQRSLRRLGYHVRVDGRFGRLTVLAVLRYQSRHGLKSDGVVGRSTRRALQRSVAHVERVARRARRRRARARRHARPPAHGAAPGRPPAPGAAPGGPSARGTAPASRPEAPAAVVSPVAAPAPPAVPHALTPVPAPATPRAADAASDGRVLLTIAALAAVLLVAAVPVLRQPVRWGSPASGRRGAGGAAGAARRRPRRV